MVTRFDEAFEIVVVGGFDDTESAGDHGLYPDFLARIAADVESEINGGPVRAVGTGYGYGADAIALGLILSGLSTAFLAGKSIEENAEAWVAIGKRLLRVLRKLSSRYGAVRISEPAAFAVAMDAIANRQPDMQPIVLLAKATTRVPNASLTPEAQAQFLMHPDRYYVFTVEAGFTTHVVAVDSIGDVLFHHVLDRDRDQFLRLDTRSGV